jgi:hypothetical protein
LICPSPVAKQGGVVPETINATVPTPKVPHVVVAADPGPIVRPSVTTDAIRLQTIFMVEPRTFDAAIVARGLPHCE